MKSFLIIGMGSFGRHLCRCLAQRKCDLMIVDRHEERLEDLLPYVVSAKVGECTNIEVLRSFGVPEFDACFVCIGGKFQESLEITSLLRELGAKKIYSKAEQDLQAKFLLRVGADEVIYPELDAAERIAISESNDNIFNCIDLTEEHKIFEIRTRKQWVGKSIRELSFRSRFNLSILAIKNGEELNVLPSPDYVFQKDDHPLVLGHIRDIERVVQD